MNLKALSSDPRYVVLSALLVYLIYNLATIPTTVSFIVPVIITVIASAAIELLLWKHEGRALMVPFSAIITSLIVSFIFTPTLATVHFSILAVAIAIISKHFIKIGFTHVFNPANFGALIVSFLPFASLQTWWVASNPLLVGILGLAVIWRVKAWFITLPFLALTFVLEGVRATFIGSVDGSFLIASITSAIVLFFSTIILVEPMTTPTNMGSKFVFGILAALLVFLFSYIMPRYSFLAALAIANIAVPYLDKVFVNRVINLN